ncbi:hypothetical protein N8972_01670 [Sulfurospirillum sp.]|nr:hypothetical protein [Sulfurospirillum sp.]
MKLLSILNYKALGYTFVYLALTLTTFQIAFGSYSESEARTGDILMVVGVVFVIIGILLAKKFKPNYILWEKVER